jgi:hypothetical protein
MAFIAIRNTYTADLANLWVSKKAFRTTDSFAIVMFVETDMPSGTAFEAHFQIVNPRVQAGNWSLPRSITSTVSAVGHSHSINVFGGGSQPHSHSGSTALDAHTHAVSANVPVHGATIDLVAGHPVPGPAFIVYWWSNPYSAIVAGLQGSETQVGFCFVRGLVVIGSDELFDNSQESWYRVTS